MKRYSAQLLIKRIEDFGLQRFFMIICQLKLVLPENKNKLMLETQLIIISLIIMYNCLLRKLSLRVFKYKLAKKNCFVSFSNVTFMTVLMVLVQICRFEQKHTPPPSTQPHRGGHRKA